VVVSIPAIQSSAQSAVYSLAPAPPPAQTTPTTAAPTVSVTQSHAPVGSSVSGGKRPSDGDDAAPPFFSNDCTELSEILSLLKSVKAELDTVKRDVKVIKSKLQVKREL
jgi:hypothetical protein